jgi:hypothetical protein
MSEYNDIKSNKGNINNFNAGSADMNVHTPGISYQYNALSPADHSLRHGYELSIACESGTDMLHSIGNVTAVMLQFIVDQFPSNTFATVLPSTKLASRQLRHTPKQIRTQPYPMCVVNPRVSLSGLDNRLAAGSFATSTWSSTSSRFQNRSEMERLFLDNRKGIEWRGKINRTVVMLDFVLSFKSVAEQIRWASYLINRLPTDENRPFDVDTALELAIPDGFLYETAKYVGIPVKDEHGSVAKFTDYLNMNSVYPISYRFSSGRHKDAFYAYYTTSILCSISELNYTNVTKLSNSVESDCPITFTMRCEFNTIGLFDLGVLNHDGVMKRLGPEPNAIAIPIFSDSFNEKDYPLLYGWKFIAKPICKLDWGETEIDISSIFSDTVIELIKFHLKNGINPEMFLSIKLRENRVLINDGYYVDWRNLKLIFTTVNYATTYRLLVTMNQLYVQNMLSELYGKT